MPRFMLLSVAFSLALLSPLHAQDGSLDEREGDFAKKERATNSLRVKLFKGTEQANPADKDHREAIDVAAKSATYYLHWWASKRGPGQLNQKVKDFTKRLDELDHVKDQSSVAAIKRLYAKAVAERARQVVIAGPAIASVNAARVLYLLTARQLAKKRGDQLFWQTDKEWAAEVLPRLQGDTAETLAAACTELLARPRLNDGAKYYLLKCLADLLSLPKQDTPLLKKETRDKALLAALPVLNQKKDFALNTPREELEGWKMLRAQALLVLAASNQAVIGKEKPALYLARAAGADAGISPPPRLDERIAGALGLARLVAQGKAADLNADYAAHQVASAVAAFADEASRNIEAKPATRIRPWKADAARLLQAVLSMSASKDPHVKAVIGQCKPILEELEANRVATNAANLQDWVVATLPPSKTLIKGDADSTVKPYVPKG